MRLFLLYALVASVPALVVAAVVFRSNRAANALRTIRKVGWIYVVVLVIAGVIAGIQRNS